MATFKGAVLSCKECGEPFKVPRCRASTASTCSKQCADKQRGFAIERKVTLACRECGGAYRAPRSHATRRVYCSYECKNVVERRTPGLIGEENPSWKGGRSLRQDGYYYALAPGHPYASSGYVLEHRLVMEAHLVENESASPFLVEVGGTLRLSRAFHVHHKDEDKANNEITNLVCMTPAEHRAHHNAIIAAALKFYREHHPLKQKELNS